MNPKHLIAKLQKQAQAERNAKVRSYRIGDELVTIDPFGKHTRRNAIVVGIIPNGYRVRFTSTKGESCDGGNRKPYQRKDGTFVTMTDVELNINYSQIF